MSIKAQQASDSDLQSYHLFANEQTILLHKVFSVAMQCLQEQLTSLMTKTSSLLKTVEEVMRMVALISSSSSPR